MIKNIIFDIGRVLLEFNPKEYLLEKYTNKLLVEELYSAVFESSEWLDLDRGSITDGEAVEIFSKRHSSQRIYIMDIMKDWHNILIPIEDTVSLLKRLKQNNYRIILLSNFHLRAFEIVYEKYPFFKMADEMIISSKINLLKPSREIYEHTLHSLNLAAEECLFIDDTLANIEGAKSIGINTILFKNPAQLEQELKDLSLL